MLTKLTKGGYFLGGIKHTDLDQPTIVNGGVSRGRSVAVAVGCVYVNGTSISLQWHFNCTSKAL